MNEQQVFDAVQNIFRDNFDDDSLVLTRETTADDIEDWDSLEQINLLTAMEKQFGVKFKLDDVRACQCGRHGGSDHPPAGLMRAAFSPFVPFPEAGTAPVPFFTSRPTARRTDGGIFL